MIPRKNKVQRNTEYQDRWDNMTKEQKYIELCKLFNIIVQPTYPHTTLLNNRLDKGSLIITPTDTAH